MKENKEEIFCIILKSNVLLFNMYCVSISSFILNKAHISLENNKCYNWTFCNIFIFVLIKHKKIMINLSTWTLFLNRYCQPQAKAQSKVMPGRLYVHTK